MNDFEIIANEVDKFKQTYEVSQECTIEWIKTNKTATVTFPGGSKYNTKIRKLAQEHPDEVIIKHENKDKSIVATVPVKYIKISSPRKVSDEQKLAASERLKKMRSNR